MRLLRAVAFWWMDRFQPQGGFGRAGAGRRPADTAAWAVAARWAAALVVVAGLTSCGGKVPPTNYYILDLPAPMAKPADALPYTAVIMPFRGSEMMMQDRIVYRESPSQVGFYEYHRWAEDPRSTILRSLLDQLRAKGTFDRVVAFEGRTNVDYVIRGQLEQLEEIDYGSGVSVQVKISAQLIDASTNRPVWSDTAEATEPVSSPQVRAVVEQMSSAMRTAVGRLAEGINTHLRSSAAQSAPASARSGPEGQK
jgi:ABC-type uncharacterized transport system auxiliary subunit